MADKRGLLRALEPVIALVRELDLSSPDAVAMLGERFPLGEGVMAQVETLVRDGVWGGWLCPHGEPPVRFGGVCRNLPETGDLSITAVDMTAPGPGHRHPKGEVELCFALEGQPTFDGHKPGWVVKRPGSWHVPTVAGGRMAFVYFLPCGAIEFGPELSRDGGAPGELCGGRGEHEVRAVAAGRAGPGVPVGGHRAPPGAGRRRHGAVRPARRPDQG